MKIQYTLQNIADLEWALAIAAEIKSEVGLTPDYIETDDGTRVKYDRADFKQLENGAIGTADYIAKHAVGIV